MFKSEPVSLSLARAAVIRALLFWPHTSFFSDAQVLVASTSNSCLCCVGSVWRKLASFNNLLEELSQPQ